MRVREGFVRACSSLTAPSARSLLRGNVVVKAAAAGAMRLWRRRRTPLGANKWVPRDETPAYRARVVVGRFGELCSFENRPRVARAPSAPSARVPSHPARAICGIAPCWWHAQHPSGVLLCLHRSTLQVAQSMACPLRAAPPMVIRPERRGWRCASVGSNASAAAWGAPRRREHAAARAGVPSAEDPMACALRSPLHCFIEHWNPGRRAWCVLVLRHVLCAPHMRAFPAGAAEEIFDLLVHLCEVWALHHDALASAPEK